MAKKRQRRGRGEGSIFYSAAKQVWVARGVVGGVRVEATADTKGGAMERLHSAMEAKRRGDSAAPTAVTVAEHLDRWLETVARPTVEPTTYRTYEVNVRLHIKPRLGGLPLARLTGERVEEFYAALRRDGVSGGLARKIAAVLQTALGNAVRRKLIPASPADGVATPKHSTGDVRPFTEEEAKAILETARANPRSKFRTRLAALVSLAFATGMRRGELLALTWPLVSLDAATVRVEQSLYAMGGEYRLKVPKSRRGRRLVSLPPFAVADLTRHRQAMEAGGFASSPVFCSGGGGWMNASAFRTSWIKLLGRAGVAFRRFHNCRHTHASQLLSLGVPLTEVARRLGDRPETVLRVYCHWMPSDAGVPGKLERLYGREGGSKVDQAKKPPKT